MRIAFRNLRTIGFMRTITCPESLGRSFHLRSVQALAHFLAGLEKRHGFLVDGHMRPGSWVAARAGAAVLDRKRPETAQFNAVSPGQRRHDLTQNSVDDILHVALVEVGILSCNALDEF